VLQHGVRPRDIEEGFLFQAVEGLALFEFLLKSSNAHKKTIRVITRIVNIPSGELVKNQIYREVGRMGGDFKKAPFILKVPPFLQSSL